MNIEKFTYTHSLKQKGCNILGNCNREYFIADTTLIELGHKPMIGDVIEFTAINGNHQTIIVNGKKLL